MKFIKQLSEDEFVVKMEPRDGDRTRSIVLAHDYLQFQGLDWYCTDMSNLNAPWAYANVIHVQSEIQIPIRMAQDMLEKVLTPNRKYLKKEHLVYNGTNNYQDPNGLSYRYIDDDGKRMIAFFNRETCEYVHMELSIYNAIKNPE